MRTFLNETIARREELIKEEKASFSIEEYNSLINKYD